MSGGAWLGIEVKYQELNLRDLGWCILFGGVVRTVLHFLETSPLPEDLDETEVAVKVKETKPGEKANE